MLNLENFVSKLEILYYKNWSQVFENMIFLVFLVPLSILTIARRGKRSGGPGCDIRTRRSILYRIEAEKTESIFLLEVCFPCILPLLRKPKIISKNISIGNVWNVLKVMLLMLTTIIFWDVPRNIIFRYYSLCKNPLWNPAKSSEIKNPVFFLEFWALSLVFEQFCLFVFVCIRKTEKSF